MRPSLFVCGVKLQRLRAGRGDVGRCRAGDSFDAAFFKRFILSLPRGGNIPVFCLLCIARGADPRFIERSKVILRVPIAMLCGALCPIERVRVVLRNTLLLQIEPADLTLGQRIALFGQFQMPLEAGFIFSGFPVSVNQLAAAVVFRAGLIIIDFHRYLLVFISPTCR